MELTEDAVATKSTKNAGLQGPTAWSWRGQMAGFSQIHNGFEAGLSSSLLAMTTLAMKLIERQFFRT